MYDQEHNHTLKVMAYPLKLSGDRIGRLFVGVLSRNVSVRKSQIVAIALNLTKDWY